MADKVEKITINGAEVDKKILLDKNPETKIRLEPGGRSARDLAHSSFQHLSRPGPLAITRKAEEPPNPFSWS